MPIIESFFDKPFTEAYSYVNVPTLLIHEELPKELAAPRQRGLAQITVGIVDVSICAIPGAGHMQQWDAPQETAARIVNWMLQKDFL